MYELERRNVVGAAQLLIERRVLSLSLHANISARISGTEYFVMTGSSLADLNEDKLAVISLGGEVVWGNLAPAEREVLGMHTAFYAERPSAGAVVHTHSPHATAFAVASGRSPSSPRVSLGGDLASTYLWLSGHPVVQMRPSAISRMR